MIEIRLNGRQQQVEPGLSLEELLTRLSLPAGRVAVELNQQVVPRDRFAATSVNAGDRLEVVTLVGGG